MDGEQRREEILKVLQCIKQPISGMELAKRLGVSRQVIVQDIALLRAVNKNILSTNKGYVLFIDTQENGKWKKSIKVRHSESEILDELFTIVDYGGRVLDVVVEHPIYGQIMVDLIINSRADAEKFVCQVKENRTKPLNDLTKGIHYHTIVAQSEDALEAIEQQLLIKGYLIK